MSQVLSLLSFRTDGRWRGALFASLFSGSLLAGCCWNVVKPSGDGSIEPPRLAVWFENPEQHVGQPIRVGGRVLTATVGSIELLAYPGNDCGEADFGELPVGRILIKSPIALLPGHFPPGREVTVSGRLAGTQAFETAGVPRVLPVVEAEDLTTPSPPVFFPLPQFGFSFSGGF